MQRNNRTISVFIPTDKPERIAIPSTPDVPALVADYQDSTAITKGELFEASTANIKARVQRLVLLEGIQVALLPQPSRGVAVHLTLTLHYGDVESLKGFKSASGFLGN